MYQTGGLFHPLLSQRIYQSNQGLKLSAKAFRLPKGALICLRSRRRPNDSKADMKQGRSCCFLGEAPGAAGPTIVPPARLPPPALSPRVSIWLYLSCPSFQSDTSFTSGFQLTGPAARRGPACPGQSASPHSGRCGRGNPAARR